MPNDNDSPIPSEVMDKILEAQGIAPIDPEELKARIRAQRDEEWYQFTQRIRTTTTATFTTTWISAR